VRIRMHKLNVACRPCGVASTFPNLSPVKYPAHVIASRSLVMPSLEMLPRSQYQ